MRRLFCIAVVGQLLASSLLAQNLIINGDFEEDTYLTFPGYNGGENNPAQITGWVPTGNGGINPTFAPTNPTTILGWTRGEDSLQQIGINPITDERAPFADNGDVDGGIMFMQGTSSAYQVVEGLTVGETYLFGADYNARNCCGDTPTVSLELNGDATDEFPDPDEFFDGEVLPVESGLWWRTELEHTATSESLRVEFFTESTLAGDSTFTVDNVTLEPVGGGDNLIINGDFEDNLDAFVQFPGYLGSGQTGGSAPFRDNGNNATQVAFLQGEAAMEQEITGLNPGTEYTLSFDYNARNCCGDLPVPSLLIDDEPIFDFEDEAGAVFPVEADNDWYSFETTFTPEDDFAVLKLQTMSEAGGDSTFLVDNIFFGVAGSTGCDPNSKGDLDGNGKVEFADFLVLSGNFGKALDPADHTQGDIDCNGTVEFADFLVLSGNFGTDVAATESVPEPTTAGMLICGMLGLLKFSRRSNRKS